MSSISMVEARMPPGFRFHPTDDELVLDYLSRRLSGRGGGTYSGVAVVDVDLNKCEPWDLPEVACVGGKEWYFFTLRDRKYATGQRMNRATVSGYWKATGKDRVVTRHDMVVGMRKTLVFYKGRAPKGKKTEWVMHEFRMEGQLVVDRPKFSPKEDWVLCRVFYRSRATTPRSASVEAGTLSNELGVLAAPPITPLIDAYITFDRAPLTTVEGYDQVPYFSGLPKGSVTSGDMVGSDTCDKKTMRVVLSNNSKLEFSQHWSQEHGEGCMLENGMPQIWNPF